MRHSLNVSERQWDGWHAEKGSRATLVWKILVCSGPQRQSLILVASLLQSQSPSGGPSAFQSNGLRGALVVEGALDLNQQRGKILLPRQVDRGHGFRFPL